MKTLLLTTFFILTACNSGGDDDNRTGGSPDQAATLKTTQLCNQTDDFYCTNARNGVNFFGVLLKDGTCDQIVNGIQTIDFTYVHGKGAWSFGNTIQTACTASFCSATLDNWYDFSTQNTTSNFSPGTYAMATLIDDNGSGEPDITRDIFMCREGITLVANQETQVDLRGSDLYYVNNSLKIDITCSSAISACDTSANAKEMRGGLTDGSVSCAAILAGTSPTMSYQINNSGNPAEAFCSATECTYSTDRYYAGTGMFPADVDSLALGTYTPFIFIDQNDNGSFDSGEVMFCEDDGVVITAPRINTQSMNDTHAMIKP